MRAVVQRVSHCTVTPAGDMARSQGKGILAYVGVERGDEAADAAYVAGKIASMRIFPDQSGKMSRSVGEVGGAVTVVSQFTLHGDARRGRRPSFSRAEDPALAGPLCDQVAARLRDVDIPVTTGLFGAHMRVESCNDGPVTILLDSRRSF